MEEVGRGKPVGSGEGEVRAYVRQSLARLHGTPAPSQSEDAAITGPDRRKDLQGGPEGLR